MIRLVRRYFARRRLQAQHDAWMRERQAKFLKHSARAKLGWQRRKA